MTSSVGVLVAPAEGVADADDHVDLVDAGVHGPVEAAPVQDQPGVGHPIAAGDLAMTASASAMAGTSRGWANDTASTGAGPAATSR